jgi:choline dehydrogenase-like flavoprotein
MQINNLDDFGPGSEFEADIAIIGAGPAGITIAREFLNSPYRVLLIESGLVDEHEPHAPLNHVESEGEPAGEAGDTLSAVLWASIRCARTVISGRIFTA